MPGGILCIMLAMLAISMIMLVLENAFKTFLVLFIIFIGMTTWTCISYSNTKESPYIERPINDIVDSLTGNVTQYAFFPNEEPVNIQKTFSIIVHKHIFSCWSLGLYWCSSPTYTLDLNKEKR